MTEWRPAEFEDLLSVNVQVAQSWQDLRDQLPAKPTDEIRNVLSCNARTLWEGGRTLACIGISPLWKGVGAAWALISQEAIERPIALTRGTLDWLVWIMDRDGLWRVQATVEHGHAEARRWLIWMGFSFEGTMRVYSHMGMDHDMYARINPEDVWHPQPPCSA